MISNNPSYYLAPASTPLTLPADDAPGRCAICYTDTSQSVSIKHLIKATTAAIADTFQTDASGVCLDCARCFADGRMTGSFYATANAVIRPTVVKTDGRYTWRDLLRGAKSEASVTIMTSNTKRRLWTRARVSEAGKDWQVLFVHDDVDAVLKVDFEQAKTCLTLVEAVYSAGFSKAAIAESLFTTYQKFDEAAYYEPMLKAWRGSNELRIALFCAQKDV